MTTHDLAMRLYKAAYSDEVWLALFTKRELIGLWNKCKNDRYIEYDDEVFNALDTLGYFKK